MPADVVVLQWWFALNENTYAPPSKRNSRLVQRCDPGAFHRECRGRYVIFRTTRQVFRLLSGIGLSTSSTRIGGCLLSRNGATAACCSVRVQIGAAIAGISARVWAAVCGEKRRYLTTLGWRWTDRLFSGSRGLHL